MDINGLHHKGQSAIPVSEIDASHWLTNDEFAQDAANNAVEEAFPATPEDLFRIITPSTKLWADTRTQSFRSLPTMVQDRLRIVDLIVVNNQVEQVLDSMEQQKPLTLSYQDSKYAAAAYANRVTDLTLENAA